MGEGQRERGRHRIWSRLQVPSCQHRARCRARTHTLWDHDLSRSRIPNRLSHPGAPGYSSFDSHLQAHLPLLWTGMRDTSLQATSVTLTFSWLLIRLCQWEVMAGDGDAGGWGRDLFLLPPQMCLSPNSSRYQWSYSQEMCTWVERPTLVSYLQTPLASEESKWESSSE